MKGYDEGVVAPTPLNSAACARPELVSAGEDELEETLNGDEGHRKYKDGPAQRVTLAVVLTEFEPSKPSANRRGESFRRYLATKTSI